MSISKRAQRTLVTFENRVFHIGAKESLHLYILGPRSAGKSTLSEYISKKLGIKCYDMDSELEKKLRVDGAGGGLSNAIKSKAWQKISMALQESLYELLDLDFSYVASIPTGIFAYEQSALLLESVVILGILPGKTEEEALALLIERERERIHFRERVKENSQDEQEVVREYRHGLSKAITLTQTQSDACYFYGNETPSVIVRKCFGIP